MQTGDIDFVMLSTANASTAQPESGVFSLHFIFRDEAHAIKVLGDPAVIAAMKELYAAKMKGAHMLGLGSQGLRHMYGKKAVEKVADIKGVKVRVQATVTEDTLFPAYGAQVVHMPFGEVYTSLQTGVVDMAENGINNYLINKHYEPAPVLSLTEHEANNSALFVSDKVWSSLTDEQKKWVQAAADEVSRNEPAAAFKLEHEALAKLEKIGVKVVKTVDKIRLCPDQQADPGQAGDRPRPQRREGSRPGAQRKVSRPFTRRGASRLPVSLLSHSGFENRSCAGSIASSWRSSAI